MRTTNASFSMLEPLESRQFLSIAPLIEPIVPTTAIIPATTTTTTTFSKVLKGLYVGHGNLGGVGKFAANLTLNAQNLKGGVSGVTVGRANGTSLAFNVSGKVVKNVLTLTAARGKARLKLTLTVSNKGKLLSGKIAFTNAGNLGSGTISLAFSHH